MSTQSSDPESSRPGGAVRPRVAAVSIIAFWGFYFASVTARAAIMNYSGQGEMLWRRTLVALAGMGLSWLLYLALRPLDRASLGTRITAAFVASIPAAAAYAAVNYVAFYVFWTDPMMLDPDKMDGEHASVAAMIADNAINWYFFIVSWAALYLILSYAGAVRESERRAARFRAAAQAAELRALRYQVNPHFLFNTLNSLSSLVMTDKREEAERMIMNLSTFFRTSLAGDPGEDVPLFEEIRLQRLYLDIEAVRFPDRLKVRISVPDPLRTACVPGLILQPLVENAIKYGVSRARRPVTISIIAREDSDGLVLAVEDDGDPLAEGEGGKGTGVGLRNVRDRLAARFGPAGLCRWGTLPGGGFGVTLYMPLTRNVC